jgi:hypothetical protein
VTSKQLRIFVTTALLAVMTQVSADDGLTPQGLLALGKYTGACGILTSIVNFQTATDLPGGDEFVTRFWSVEAARLGVSVEELAGRCAKSISAYDKLWEATKPGTK